MISEAINYAPTQHEAFQISYQFKDHGAYSTMVKFNKDDDRWEIMAWFYNKEWN